MRTLHGRIRKLELARATKRPAESRETIIARLNRRLDDIRQRLGPDLPEVDPVEFRKTWGTFVTDFRKRMARRIL
jgi:hypothetical protein